MSFTNAQVVDRFVKGKNCGKSRNMSIGISRNEIYSYSMPLMVRMPWGLLMNADKRSVTTSSHQRACMRYATVQIPFSALIAAGLPTTYGIEAIELVDKAGARYDHIGWVKINAMKGERRIITDREYDGLSVNGKEFLTSYDERRPEACVLKYKERYFLSSMDSNWYFLSELPRPVRTVDEAFEVLLPERLQKDKTVEYKRQGEWFFVEAPVMSGVTPKQVYQSLQKRFELPKDRPNSNAHIATRGLSGPADKKIFVSGSIHHSEHRMLVLSKAGSPKIFEALHNSAVASWSAGGRVD